MSDLPISSHENSAEGALAPIYNNSPNEEMLTLSQSLGQRLSEDFTVFKDEISEPSQRVRRTGAAVLGVATQTFDRARAMVIALPYAFDHALTYAGEHGLNGYETAGLAGVAVGGTFGVWGWMVGRSFDASINAFPETTKTVTHNHPAMVEVVSKAVGGFVRSEDIASKTQNADGTYDIGAYEGRKNIVTKVGLGIGRALKSALLYGTTAYVGMAKVKGYSKESRDSLRRTVTAESAGAWATIAAGVSAAVTNSSYEVAQTIRDTLTNRTYIFGATAFFIGSATISNLFARRSAKKDIEQNVFETDQI